MSSLAIPFPQSKTAFSFHWLMAGLVALLFALDLALTQSMRLSGFPRSVAETIPAFAFLVGICGYCAFRKLDRCFEFTALLIWSIAVGIGISTLILTAGRTGAPLIDGNLARIDHAMGFSTPAVIYFISGFPRVRALFAVAYNLMPLPILMALIVPVCCGRAKQTQRFIVAVLAAAVMTSVLFAFFPAAGPWVDHFQPSKAQSEVQAYLGTLKSSAVLPVDSSSAGVVSFPSFHVVLALLPVFALWPIRYTRIPMVAIALLICVSTITTGWHYGIDVIGGIAVACAAWKLAA